MIEKTAVDLIMSKSAKSVKSLMSYRWLPGVGADAVALSRLVKNFPLPQKPMGEAWFMADERVMYTELMIDDASAWPREPLLRALEALASGPGCFGALPEWTEWLHFLLTRVPDLVDDWHTSALHETLVSAFMAEYPLTNNDAPYSGFFDDVLMTLGQTLLDQRFWRAGRMLPRKALSHIDETVYGRVISSGDAFSASLFLVLKYLPAGLIEEWVESIIAIDDPIWRSKSLLWLAETRALTLEDDQPLSVLDRESAGGAGWQWCWSLNGSSPGPAVDASAIVAPFVDTARRVAFINAVRKNLCQSVLQSWRDALLQAAPELGDVQSVISQFDVAAEIVATSYTLR